MRQAAKQGGQQSTGHLPRQQTASTPLQQSSRPGRGCLPTDIRVPEPAHCMCLLLHRLPHLHRTRVSFRLSLLRSLKIGHKEVSCDCQAAEPHQMTENGRNVMGMRRAPHDQEVCITARHGGMSPGTVPGGAAPAFQATTMKLKAGTTLMRLLGTSKFAFWERLVCIRKRCTRCTGQLTTCRPQRLGIQNRNIQGPELTCINLATGKLSVPYGSARSARNMI